MEYSLEEKYSLIKESIIKETSKNPIEIAKNIMQNEFVNIHGPEHHFLDGAAFLAAYKNAGGDIDLILVLNKLEERSIKMPGAMCGHWGICGSIASIGATLSIIHQTGPLSNDDFYKDHMEYISIVISKMSEIGGPRCCKRNAFLSLSEAVKFVEKKYHIIMDLNDISCEFYSWNKQCILKRCPYHR